MKKLLRYALLCAVAMCSSAAMAATTTVGNENNTTEFWTAFSDYYAIEPNKTLTLKFKNYSNKAFNYCNWAVVVATDADRGADSYSEYCVLRADNWAWQGALNTGAESSHDWFTSLTSNYNWDTFLADMDGSDVVMTIKRQESEVTIHADITTAAGASYYEEFVINRGEATSTLRAFLTIEGGHLVIDDDATLLTDTNTPTSIIGSEDNTTAFWSAFSDYYTIDPDKTLTLKFQNFSNKSFNWCNWAVVLATDAARGTDGYSEYCVLRADNWAWQGALNTGAESSHDWFTSLTSNYNWDTFPADMDGSTVVMTIKRLNEVVTIHADITTAAGASYFEDFVINCGEGTQPIRAFLTIEGGHLIIDNTATTITDTEVPPTITIEGEQLGSTDLTDGFWSVFSDSYTLQKNQVLELDFTNYTDKAANWDNWAVVVTTDADRAAPAPAPAFGPLLAETEYAEYFVFRADSYCWGMFGNSNPDDAAYYEGYQLTNNFNWDTFKDDMNGAKVKLTVTRDGAKITAHADVTTVGGTEYFEQLVVDNCGDGEQAIRAFLTVDHSCIDLTKHEITNNPNPSTGISTVKATDNTATVRYNLAGQRVGADFKGVVIENSRKVMVK